MVKKHNVWNGMGHTNRDDFTTKQTILRGGGKKTRFCVNDSPSQD